MGQSHSTLNRRAKSLEQIRFTSTDSIAGCVGDELLTMDSSSHVDRDYINSLPDECLALIFHSLSSGDRKKCSLVCRRWLIVEGQSRRRLSLDARATLAAAAPALLARFDSVAKLALKCDRRADSIDDVAFSDIVSRCPNLLRLKIRYCRNLTPAAMPSLAFHCQKLRKLSCASCTFGPPGVFAIVRISKSLEELSLKRVRGPAPSNAAGEDNNSSGVNQQNQNNSDSVITLSSPLPGSLRSISLKELYNAQCFAPLVSAAAPNLTTLRLSRCSGDWDKLLEEIAPKATGLIEIHLEKLQVGDRGLAALVACTKLEILHLVKAPECTDAGLISLAEGCRKLRKLHIDGWKTNRIGDPALAAVARRCPELQELVLIGVNPTAESLTLVAAWCRRLERLALCGSETFGDDEIACIADKCLALKKLCIKGCPVTDEGMVTLARGCPNLVKVKVKKCKNVTPDFADRLRNARGSLAVNLDIAGSVEPLDASDSGLLDNGADQMPSLVDQIAAMDLPSSSSGRSAFSRARMGILAGRNFVTSAFRRWSSHGNNGGGGSSSGLHQS